MGKRNRTICINILMLMSAMILIIMCIANWDNSGIDSFENIKEDIDRNFAIDNIDILYINTSTGSMKEVNDDKNHKEPISIKYISSDGDIIIETTDALIKGHGNSSWKKDKKPYKITLSSDNSLEGMGGVEEWILLANAFDSTHMKNVMVMETAQIYNNNLMPYYRYVNLYLNGKYSGLYVMAQSVEDFVKKNNGRAFLAVSDTSGAAIEKSGLTINEYASAKILLPKDISESEIKGSAEHIKAANEIISMGQTNDKDSYIDYDSWADAYLFDEFFQNFDAGIRSNYFYWYIDGEDISPIYAGPLWDYDIAMGNKGRAIRNPAIIYAGQNERSSTVRILWYADLLKDERFKTLVVEKYNSSFRESVLSALEKADSIYESIEESRELDNVRWNIDEPIEWADIEKWVYKRIDFLDKVWVVGADYVCVTIDNGGYNEYDRYYVERGKSLIECAEFVEFEDIESYYYTFGENKVILTDAIMGDVVMKRNNLESKTTKKEKIILLLRNNCELFIVVMLIALLSGIFILWMIRDLSQNTERKDSRRDGKVSS